MKEHDEENEFTRRLRDAIVMLDAEKRARVRLEMENTRLRDALAEKSRALEAAERNLQESLEGLRAAEEELAEHRSVDEKIAEFEKILTKVEDLKQDYERRIGQLRMRLQSAETRLKSLKITLSERDLPDLEEVEIPVRNNPREPSPKPTERSPKTAEQPLRPAEPSPNTTEQPDSTDWLMDLPDF